MVSTARGRTAILVVLIVVSSSFLFLVRTDKVSLSWPRASPKTLANANSPSPDTSKFADTRLTWTGSSIPQTTLQVHVTGWSVFDNLYALNGTLYIVTNSPTTFPPRREVTSSKAELQNVEGNVEAREPTDRDMQIISTAEATTLFGQSASRMNGVNMITNDPDQFLGHYYHFCAETLIGIWRTYSSLDTNITPNGDTVLPPPTRLIFPHGKSAFRDHAGVNHVVLRAAFPSIAIEYEWDWDERASTAKPFVMDRVILTARSTTERAKGFDPDAKMLALADRLPKSPYWWTPIRKQVLEFVGASPETIMPSGTEKPVITYISRQGSPGRKLADKSHRSLVKALQDLQAQHGYEVNIVQMETLTKPEQIKLSARTTIMIGTHGNGLTSMLWMRPSPSATVIEIYYPPGFSTDYSVPARVLGIEHYGVWNGRYFRSNSEHKPERNQPDGFHGDQIPVDGPTIAALCLERIVHPTLLASKMTKTK
ncbi:hypothetical protein FRB93_005189 [Tulasnella sp. JGI-2019a]|nr:hypothetical protein FRB93_005189 [Tulasnella sp. JGI-2019a]